MYGSTANKIVKFRFDFSTKTKRSTKAFWLPPHWSGQFTSINLKIIILFLILINHKICALSYKILDHELIKNIHCINYFCLLMTDELIIKVQQENVSS